MNAEWWMMPISAASALSGMALGVLGYRRASRRDMEEAGRNDGKVQAELEYIKAGIEEIKAECRLLRAGQQQLAERLIRAEERITRDDKKTKERAASYII